MIYELTEEYLSETIQALSKKDLKKYAKNAVKILTAAETKIVYDLKVVNTKLRPFIDSVQKLEIPLTSQDCAIIWFHN